MIGKSMISALCLLAAILSVDAATISLGRNSAGELIILLDGDTWLRTAT